MVANAAAAIIGPKTGGPETSDREAPEEMEYAG